MTTPAPVIEGSVVQQQAARDWQAIHVDPTIQYVPLEISTKPAEQPGWLKALLEGLQALFEPLGNALGMSWPVMKWVLVGLAVTALGYTIWRLIEPWRERGPKAEAAEPDSWAPAREEALALLEEADRLAAEGRFGEATHLLLRRSVAQIAAARPDWVLPASTARELAALPALPEQARGAFAAITQRVEQAFYALRDLNAQDWAAARSAYSEFALARLPTIGAGP